MRKWIGWGLIIAALAIFVGVLAQTKFPTAEEYDPKGWWGLLSFFVTGVVFVGIFWWMYSRVKDEDVDDDDVSPWDQWQA